MAESATGDPQWLEWAKRLESIAQAGLTYAHSDYDRDRYRQVREIALDVLARHASLDQIGPSELFASDDGYRTPKVDVRAAVFQEDGILLVREKTDGKWSLPGGWADVHTSVREAVIKEAKEEAGAEVAPRRIIAIQDRRRHNLPPAPFTIYKIFVECDLIACAFEKNAETSEVGFFGRSDLPPFSEGRTTSRQVEMCFAARSTEKLEAWFD